VTVIPDSLTSEGIRLAAFEIRVCTFTAAWSGSVPALKNTLMVPDPELLEEDRIYVISMTPLMASSMGRSAAWATVSALAPGSESDTVTLGGAISGNRVMGSCVMDTNPRITRSDEITVARTGLLMKVLSILHRYPLSLYG